VEFDVIQKLTKELKTASITLSDAEARFLVDSYYQMQDNRIRSDGQIRAIDQGVDVAPQPHAVLDWLSDNCTTLENQIKRALAAYSDSKPIGVWAKSICGIGDVISAGLIAHIDITKAPTYGSIWKYAGLDPSCVWEKKTKRPWNAQLKTLCWKIGESFVKVSGNEKDFYGHLYALRKTELIEQNDALMFKDVALEKAEKVGKKTDAYKSYSIGKLPPAHIHARAKRVAVKLFLSHYHEMAYLYHYGKPYEGNPYSIAILGHTHKIEPPVC